MKLAVYTDSPKVEKITTLKLEHSMYGISLIVVDQEGESVKGGVILDISEAGIIDFRTGVHPSLGFELNDEGEVRHN